MTAAMVVEATNPRAAARAFAELPAARQSTHRLAPPVNTAPRQLSGDTFGLIYEELLSNSPWLKAGSAASSSALLRRPAHRRDLHPYHAKVLDRACGSGSQTDASAASMAPRSCSRRALPEARSISNATRASVPMS